MAFKLAIGNVIGVKIKANYSDDTGADRPANFVLVCQRLTAKEMEAAVSDKQETVLGFFERVTQGWRDQRLVLDEDGNPASFSVDALRELMNVSGMANICWLAYLQQVQVVAKN